jgi:diphthamide biosynthesis enzyme Dph1/Dph2-like protein
MKSIYDLEVDKVIKEIKNNKAKTVLLQLADGIKQHSGDLADQITEKTDAEVTIWLGPCFGGCDIPITLRHKIDLVFQFGHNKFVKNPEGWR